MPLGKNKALLLDPEWRLSHLYQIADKQGRCVQFVPNPVQARLYRALHYRNIIPKARQEGVTTLINLMALDRCLFHRDQNAGTIAHTKGDAAAIFDSKIRYAYERLPDAIKGEIRATTDRVGEMSFSNGSKISISNSFRSGTLQFLHVSELGKLALRYPERAKEVKTGALPAVPSTGIICVESTAEGASGLFYDLCEQAARAQQQGVALHPLAWRLHFLPWWEQAEYRLGPGHQQINDRLREYFAKLEARGIVLDQAQREWYAATEATQGTDMFKEYPSTYEECWQAVVEGAYFATQLRRMRNEGRITRVPHEPGVPVTTAWDLGMDDATTIWFVQSVGREVRLIDYYECSGEGLEHYANVLRTKAQERGFSYSDHAMPHDVKVRELGSGKSRYLMAQELGIKPITVAPGSEGASLHDGLEAVRRLLAHCWIDEDHCEGGLRCLEHYRKEWDSANGVYLARPHHDWASHGADSLRTLALTYHAARPGQGLDAGSLPRQAQEV